MKKLITLFSFVILNSQFAILLAQPPKSYTSSEILLQLKKLNTVGSVLYIAAHPDDENTRLITYLANEKCLRTGYLSLTRGDGGQNLIGAEQGVDLGVIRTQELLAARRIDGGEQFFTRAYDFGFSKTPEETFNKWNKDSILSDMVWVIRNFRPDIIITRFATDGSGGHGHHTASAILAEEAFDAAADKTRFPEQLQYVDVWQTRRMFYNATNRFRNPNADMSAFIKLDVGGYNPLLGKSYGEIAAESRSMHKSQGFGSAKQRGEYFEYFKPVKGDTANLKDIFQGIDFSWNRVKGGENIEKELHKIINDYDINTPYKSLMALIKLNKTFIKSTSVPYYYQKLLQKIAVYSSGAYREVTAQNSNYSIGEKVIILNSRLDRNGDWNGALWIDSIIYPTKKITELYWLENPLKNNLFDVNKHLLLVNNLTSSFIKSFHFIDINSSFHLSDSDAIQYKWTDPEKGELYRPLVITPPVMINPQEQTLLFNDNTPKEIKVKVIAGKDSVRFSLSALVPEGWQVRYLNKDAKTANSGTTVVDIFLEKKGEEKTLSFWVTAPQNAEAGTLSFQASTGFREVYTKGIKEIKYDHIPVQTLFPEAEVKLVKLDVKRKLKRIGYITGAGDNVQECLQQLGYEVTTLTNEKLANENLTQYDAIITGIRAYNVNEHLTQHKQKLMDYVAQGGNLLVQYNTNSWAGPLNNDFAPYPFKLTRNRITDEDAKVNFELPEHPVLNTPNKITAQDFEGWIQERSIYHAGDWDSNYVAPLSMADPNEKPDKGALIIAKHGKGNFIYTGLVFFRELPAGVGGAYRLFVNLIELGK